MIMKKLMISMACCAFVAPLALGDGLQTAYAYITERGLTVQGTTPAITVEGGEVAGYQPAKTLVVHNQGRGQYLLEGTGHVVNSRGDRVQGAVRAGTRVHVYFANVRGVRTIDHVVVD